MISDGEEDAIRSIVEEIRALDPSGIFIKNGDFLPEIEGAVGELPSLQTKQSHWPLAIEAAVSGRGLCMIEPEAKIPPNHNCAYIKYHFLLIRG